MWRNSLEFALDLVRHIESVDKGIQAVLIETFSGAREIFQLLVGTLHTLSTQDGLHRLSYHHKVALQICGEHFAAQPQFAETTLQRAEREQGVCKGHTSRTPHSTVGKVTLQTRDRKLRREMREQCIRQAQIAFGVLKVNRIHLMRHGATANLSFGDTLTKVLETDVGPKILAEIEQNDVHTAHHVEESRLIIVMTHLGGVLLTVQTKLTADKVVRKLAPVLARIGGEMGVQTTGRATKLG
mmetsp:Transcript_20455/g.51814  ORF Transcript_20455/g.51814 Transcript_20455/m.51814 type:complete len:241 (-) Transcript_20455:772-1494(-)